VPQVLVAPEGFKTTCPSKPAAAAGEALRAPEVAAAIGRGLERAGLQPPDLCPLASGGVGTVEVLLPVLGGETAAGYCLVDGGGTAITEDRERLGDAAASGAEVVIYCAADDPNPPAEGGGPDFGGIPALFRPTPRLVVLCGPVTPVSAWEAVGARTVPGGSFVLTEIGFDERMRAAQALVTGTGLLTRDTLRDVVGEAATRARQAGVPAHAIVGANGLDLFDRRILDLQHVLEAPDLNALEAAGERLAELI
jgi:glycerate kinase